MIKVALAGAQDTGKTTVARILSGKLSARGIVTHYVQEFARDYIPKAGNVTSMAEELFLVEQQSKREQETPKTADVMVTDSPVFLAFAYALLMVEVGKMPKKDIMMLGRVYDKILDHGGYDLVFLLLLRWETQEDGVRPVELVRMNATIDKKIEAFIVLHGIRHVCLQPDTSDRFKAVTHYAEEAEQQIMKRLGRG